MICPIISANYSPRRPFNCIKEKCGWWDKYQEECAILSLTKAVQDITNIKKER